MRKSLKGVTIVLLLVAMYGCCRTRSCIEPGYAGPSTRWFAASVHPVRTQTGTLWSESIREAVRQAGMKPLNILVLSGGGQNGAFGAGFLNGLNERNDSQDLKFDIVTGISTGALQATFAFLGPKYYDKLKEAYTTVTKEDVFRNRCLFGLLCASSLKDTAPLRSLVEKYITADVLHQVAEAHEAGRRLYIGTVNLDTGEFLTWNMGSIAEKGNEEALQLYRDVLMAATSVPVLFPPVLVRQENRSVPIPQGLHTDGGVRQIVFFRQFMIDVIKAEEEELARSTPEKPIARLHEATMSVIVNGKVGLGYECTQERWASVGLRSLSAMLDESSINALFRAYVLARKNAISFRMIRIPDDVEIDSNSEEFNPETMKRLFEAGRSLAKIEPIPWETKPPTAEDLDAL